MQLRFLRKYDIQNDAPCTFGSLQYTFIDISRNSPHILRITILKFKIEKQIEEILKFDLVDNEKMRDFMNNRRAK